MSDYYASSNEEGARNLYYKRLVYSLHSRNEAYKNLVDFSFAEKALYGRIDRYHVPIHLPQSHTTFMKRIKATVDPKAVFQAVSFVADAFNDLVMQFQKNALGGKISNNEQYLSTIMAHQAYQSPLRQYTESMASFDDIMRRFYTDENIYYANFDEFFARFMSDLDVTVHQTPYTYPAFLKSRLCPMSVTGLVIEIADLDAADDDVKMTHFFNNKNWAFFLNACRSYGFLVDQHKPWRLVADLGSPVMMEYAARYGYAGTDFILMQLYTPAGITYYERFKTSLLGAYNKLKTEAYTVREQCSSGQNISRIVRPRQYQRKEFLEMYSEEFFMEAYFKIRFREEEADFSTLEQERIIKDCISLAKAADIPTALTVFARILNKTYSYEGSLTDRTHRAIMSTESLE
jgi:hypothetical protein